ncbi:hypothetical protein BKD30_04960 [Tersicoccus phoenicis]|uniref:DUF3099 domain-containing protein n=1 Tax=Tersicoccus phoenicis TaxID=554083 RepID=A0A1R1LFK0_9MICC|nr:DUF3099 domain-containing protein [Tersicoccus phoenicis]OMH26317.1 hypothetical protein BKD30_04960 [Tersicoccus phoenicis]
MMTQNHTTGRGPRRRPENPDVHTITDAQQSHTADMNGRMIRYATSMGIRLVCIVLAFVFDGWLRWVMIAGAVILPWIAVVIANAGGTVDVSSGNPAPVTTPTRPALTRGPDAEGTEQVLDGEILDDEPGDGEPGEGEHPDDRRQGPPT